jgi:hypothetical protein
MSTIARRAKIGSGYKPSSSEIIKDTQQIARDEANLNLI